MCRSFVKLVGGLAAAVMIIGLVLLAGMRTKCPPVLTAVRRFNRAVGNPRAMKTAGTPGAYASVIRHVGRTSGNGYETPVGAFATDDGFLIALPYGQSADWVKNVLASGSAVLVDEGGTYRVTEPEIVATGDVVEHLPAGEQRMLRLFGVSESLRFGRVEAAD
jgi:deazaflavin-dependent oxidoreductase (nitroreductase family)